MKRRRFHESALEVEGFHSDEERQMERDRER